MTDCSDLRKESEIKARLMNQRAEKISQLQRTLSMEVRHHQYESDTKLNAFAPLMKHTSNHGKHDAYCDVNVIKEVDYEKQRTYKVEASATPSSYREESSYYNEASEHEATKDFFAKKPGDGSPFERKRA